METSENRLHVSGLKVNWPRGLSAGHALAALLCLVVLGVLVSVAHVSKEAETIASVSEFQVGYRSIAFLLLLSLAAFGMRYVKRNLSHVSDEQQLMVRNQCRLGTRHSVACVRWRGRELLVGVAEGSIALLAVEPEHIAGDEGPRAKEKLSEPQAALQCHSTPKKLGTRASRRRSYDA